ncbi:MAG: glycoside hydrolase family 5 protein [Pseudomonadota bacterium]
MRFALISFGYCLAACSLAGEEAAPPDPARALATPPITRCINLGSALEAAYEGEWGYTVRKEDLIQIREAGFDTVRLPVRWSAHAQAAPPYRIRSAKLQRVQEIVDWTEALGLNIIINVHHYDALNEDPDAHEPRLEAIWDQLAAAFAGASDRVIFETLNEPHSNMTQARTDALNRRLMQRIRRDHPDRWVILSTANWGNLEALEQARPDYDPRAILTFHTYSPFEFTHQGAPWTEATETGIDWGDASDLKAVRADLDAAHAVQTRQHMPVFIGEFGVYEGVSVAARAQWTRVLRTEMEARDLSWCYWDFAGSLKAYDMDADAWIPEIKAALLD